MLARQPWTAWRRSLVWTFQSGRSVDAMLARLARPCLEPRRHRLRRAREEVLYLENAATIFQAAQRRNLEVFPASQSAVACEILMASKASTWAVARRNGSWMLRLSMR